MKLFSKKTTKTGMIVGIVCAALAVAVLIGSMGVGSSDGIQNFDGSYLSYRTSSGFGGALNNWASVAATNAFNVSGGNMGGEHDRYDYGDRIVVANAGVSLQTKMYDACAAAIKAKLAELGGRADAWDEENYQSGRQAAIVARVPGKKLDAFLDSLPEYATVMSQSKNFSDVTDTLIDTESKREALEAEKEALLKLFDQAGNVDEAMRVQQRLSQVRGDLESYLKTLQSLQSQVEYSTVQIWISEVDRISTPSQSFGDLAGSGFLNSIKRIGAGLRNFTLWLIAAIPYLVILAIPATVGVLLLRRSMKKRRANKQAKEAVQA